MVSRLVLIALVSALLAACSAPAPKPAPPPEPPTSGRDETRPTRASSSLVEQGRQARLAGDYERADGLLQRAQRVEPRNAGVYLELSRLYRDRGDPEAARHVAERGLLYCQGSTCEKLRKEL
jgi:Tfp pilus assembly protein PilF